MSTKPDCCDAFSTVTAARAAERRRRIVDAARELFVAQGFHNTGIAQIAQKSGVLVGQIYRDFASKEDIVAAIVERDLESFLDDEVLHRAAAAGDRETCREWLIAFIDPAEAGEECLLMADIMAETGRNARIAGIFDSINGLVRQRLMTALRACAAKGVAAPDLDAMADAIMAVSLGMICTRVTRRDKDLGPATRVVQATIGRELDRLCREVTA